MTSRTTRHSNTLLPLAASLFTMSCVFAGCAHTPTILPAHAVSDGPDCLVRVTYYPADRPRILLATLSSSGEYIRVPGLEPNHAKEHPLSRSRVPSSRVRDMISRIISSDFCRSSVNEFAFGGSYYEIQVAFTSRDGSGSRVCTHRCAEQLICVRDYSAYIGVHVPEERSDAIRSLIRVPLQELRDLDRELRNTHE